MLREADVPKWVWAGTGESSSSHWSVAFFSGLKDGLRSKLFVVPQFRDFNGLE